MATNIHSIVSEPKILYYDIETVMGYAKVPFYQLKQYSSYLNPDHVQRSVRMVCAAWKWHGDNIIASTSVLTEKREKGDWFDDYHVVKTLHDLMSQADVVIAHNGDNFDWKMLQWRCAVNGLEPPKPNVKIDTLKIARKEFHAESKSLRYLAKKLGVDDKGQSPNWAKIFEGDEQEIKYCERYCRQDIRTLEGVYEKLRPYASNHANLNAMLSGVHHHTCPKCGHWDQTKQGYKYTKAGKYQQYKCNPKTGGCGGWSQGKKNLTQVELR